MIEVISKITHRLPARRMQDSSSRIGSERRQTGIARVSCPAKEGMEDGGFKIEVVRDEASASDVFEFQFDAAENLDVFYQPELTAEESAQGAVRPENVIGAYGVCHTKKANHRVGGAAGRGLSGSSLRSFAPMANRSCTKSIAHTKSLQPTSPHHAAG
jgi:hypothetical protein